MAFFRPARKLWLSLLLAASFSAATPIATAAAVCDGMGRNVEVTIRTKPSDIHYDNSKSRADLEQLQRRMDVKDGAIGRHPLGVTLAEFEANILTRVQIRSAAAQHCATLAAVEVTLAYPRLEVYIDRRYKPGTCEYAAILDHEAQHARFFRNSLEDHKGEIRAVVVESARQLHPMAVRSSENSASYFQDRITQLLQPSLDRLSRTTERLNASIDTASNYRAIQRLCEKW